jgi:hypothetical protein
LSSPVNRGGDNQRDAEHNRADNYSERRILVFFDFFVNIKKSAQDRVSYSKENQTDKTKISVVTKTSSSWSILTTKASIFNIYSPPLFSSTKTAAVKKRRPNPRPAARVGELPTEPGGRSV